MALLFLKVVGQWRKSLTSTNRASALLRLKYMTRPVVDHNDRTRRWRGEVLSYEPSGRAKLDSAVSRIGDRQQPVKIS